MNGQIKYDSFQMESVEPNQWTQWGHPLLQLVSWLIAVVQPISIESDPVELHVRLSHFHHLFEIIFNPLLNQSEHLFQYVSSSIAGQSSVQIVGQFWMQFNK